MATDLARARRDLDGIADAFLDHDREIWNRCDDSVVRMVEGAPVVLRCSRGLVPLPIEVDVELAPTLALGARLEGAFAIGAGRRVYPSQHLGDTDDGSVLERLRDEIDDALHRLRLEPELVAHGLEGEVQGLVLDGTGHGLDGTIWGGELLVGGPGGFRPAGRLHPLPLAGGEASIRKPWRQAAATLHALLPEAEAQPLDIWRRADPIELEVVRRQVDRGVNTPLTSSAGRLFDAVAALLGVRDEISYEGQAAIELERLAHRCLRFQRRLELELREENGGLVVDPRPLLTGLVAGLRRGEEASSLADAFHAALAEALLARDEARIDAFLCPGHVSTVIGCAPYAPIAARHRVPCVIAGFEAVDTLEGVSRALQQLAQGRFEVENAYPRAVSPTGNATARALLERTFESCASRWRGLGTIPESGLRLAAGFRDHDARDRIPVEVPAVADDPPGCRCGEVMRGVAVPEECALFAEHGTAVMVERAVLEAAPWTVCLRDPTRGGLATVLVETAEASGVGIEVREEAIPVRDPVRAACELLGLDPLYVACEGRLVAVVPEGQARAAERAMQEHPRGAGPRG